MTGAQIAARAGRQDAVIPTATGRQRLAELAFRALLLGAVGIGVLALGVLLYASRRASSRPTPASSRRSWARST